MAVVVVAIVFFLVRLAFRHKRVWHRRPRVPFRARLAWWGIMVLLWAGGGLIYSATQNWFLVFPAWAVALCIMAAGS